MKIAVTPFDITSIRKLSENGADIFILGNDEYANRLVKSFSKTEITKAVNQIKTLNKEVYISANLIIHNEDIPELEEFIIFVLGLDVDGIIFGDLAVYNIGKRNNCLDKLIYNPDTLNTNYYDPLFWARKGIKGLTISKEITLAEIAEIADRSNIEISLTGHGYLNMFHSRRPIIENFLKFNNQDYKKHIGNRNLHLIEEIRDESYPVFQDKHGTHIFRDKSLESYQEIDKLKNHLDVFIIDGIFKDTQYLLETLKNYKLLLDNFNSDKAQKISEMYQENHDSGFLYKKTVYDKY